MTGFYERRWSTAALWCQRLAIVCLPYFAMTILLHRFAKISTPQVYWLITFGLVLLVASLSLGVRALMDLWNHGYRGGSATVRGVLLSLLMLLPYVWYAWLAVQHPPFNDVSTNPISPPAFVEVARLREAGRGDGMSPLTVYDGDYANLLVSAYPKVGSRRYNTGSERIYSAVEALIADRGWQILAVRGLPAPEAAAPAEAVVVEGGNAVAPGAPQDVEVEAVASSRVFGFKSDVAIEIIAEEESTLVDMRSASRFGTHDFGTNAARIEKFLTDLDNALIGIAGEG